MRRPDELEIAWAAFEAALMANPQLPLEDRGRAALRAAFRALTPDELAEERARKIIAAVALKHDTTSVDIRRRSCRLRNTVEAREQAAYELTRAGFSQRAVGRLLGRASKRAVPAWIANHEARLRAAAPEREEASHAG